LSSRPDLRSFLEAFRQRCAGEVVRVEREVDRNLEISTLARGLAELDRFPLLFFEKVRGSSFPVVTNVHADRRKMAVALGFAAATAVVAELMFNRSLRQSSILSNGSVRIFLTRPLSALLLAIAVVLLILPLFMRCHPAVGMADD
jgi:3-polyprenyl-4-hydroxybenzoate decarboxylase